AIHDPGLFFVTMLREVLLRHGISVSGRTRTVDWKYREVTPLDRNRTKALGSVFSRPLSEIIKDTLKRSQNLYAQLLLLQVGAQLQRDKDQRDAGETGGQSKSALGKLPATPAEEAADRTTEQAGLEAMNPFLKAVPPAGSQVLEEGSGLTYRNEV